MDRPIRPLFPEWFHDEVQVMSFVLASDRQNDGDVLAMNGASAALGLSPLPFQGPIASVRLGYIDGQFVPFPTHDDLEESDLDLIVSGSKDAVLMIEGFAREMPEDRHARGHRRRPRLHPPDLRPAGGAGRQGRARSRSEYEVPAPDAAIATLRRQVFRRLQGRPSRPRASTPGPRPCAALKAAAVAELIPDPAAAERHRARAFRHRLAPLGEPRGPRFDPLRHAPRRPRLPHPAGHRLPGRRAAAGAWLGRVPTRRDPGADHRHPGHRPRRAARGRADRRILARSSCSHYYFPPFSVGEVPSDPRARPPRDRPRRAGRAERQAGAARSRGISPTRSASSPTSWNRTAPARWPASAGPRWG